MLMPGVKRARVCVQAAKYMSVYRTFGAHGSPLGKDTLSEEGWGTVGTMTSSRSRGKGSASKEFSLSSLSSSSSRASSALKGSFSLKASRFSCFIRAWGRRGGQDRERGQSQTVCRLIWYAIICKSVQNKNVSCPALQNALKRSLWWILVGVIYVYCSRRSLGHYVVVEDCVMM